MVTIVTATLNASQGRTDQKFPSLHEFLVNHFTSVMLAGLDVYSFFHNSVCATSYSPSSAILSQILLVRRYYED